MTNQMFRNMLLCMLIITLPACASYEKAKMSGSLKFFNTYDAALKAYKNGHIMEAREIVRHMDKTRPDYSKARALYFGELGPARKRLLAYYKKKGKAAERTGIWFKARKAYLQAANFSLHRARLLRKSKQMDRHIRQQRLNTLITQRRKEDAALMAWQVSHQIPHNMDHQDEAMIRDQDAFNTWVAARARRTYLNAKRNLMSGYIGAAYVDIESFLRFELDSSIGKKLLQEIKKEKTRHLHIPALNKGKTHRIRSWKKKTLPEKVVPVSKDDVQQLIHQHQWINARTAAFRYQNADGEDADVLLATIDRHAKKDAAAAFKSGVTAFRTERIDDAVKYWRIATSLQPDNTLYAKNLLRAKQLQESLRLLRHQKKQ